MSRSIWKTSPETPGVPLESDETVDVCVVGAGIAGLTVAYLLALEGRSVLVVEADAVGSGETSRTTAQLVTALDRGWSELVRVHGADRARIAAESHRAAIDRVEMLVRRERIACDFTRLDGYLLAGAHQDRFDAEYDAVQSIGLPGVSLVQRAPLGGGPALRYTAQAQLDPMKYLAGLAVAVQAHGGRIAVGVRVEAIDGTGPVVVRTADGMGIHARAAVLATNAPAVANLEASLKQYAYRSYVIAGRVPRDAVPPGLYWDLEDPFHYVRRIERPGEADDLLLVGGEDHRTGQPDRPPEDRYQRLAGWIRERVPSFGEMTDAWSGQVLETMDGLGFIGRIRPGLYVVTGDCGDGMTHATIGGLLLTDLLHERANPWQEIYDPTRLRVKAALDFVRENANTATQFLSYLSPGDADDAAVLEPGQGAVIRRGLSKVAAYRDDDGRLHECSAVCPHLGCLVNWNSGESSWDCPCHGSRFDAFGRLLNGPAHADLASLREPVRTDVAHLAFRGVILDVDGTLLDSNDAHARAWSHALEEFGRKVSVADVRPLIGMGGDKVLPKLAGVSADSDLGKQITERRGEIFRTRSMPYLQPFSGARALLLQLRARGQRLVVASSAEQADLDGLLLRADVADLIDATASSGDAAQSKPDPDIVDAAIRKSGLARESLVMIGDTPFDVEAGTRAGIPVIALRCGGWSTEALDGALRVYDDPAALLTALNHSDLADCFPGAGASTPTQPSALGGFR